MSDDDTRPPRAVVRRVRRLGAWTWAALVVGALVVGVLLVALVNPGHRIGPVQPADPPVGGTALPDTRLF